MQLHQQGKRMAPPPPLQVDELMDATLRLSDLLAEESTLIDALKFGEIARMQEEKSRLTKLLETYQAMMAADKGFLQGLPPKTREELLLRTDDLAVSVEENFRKLSVARAVNSRVMQAIMDVMGEAQRPGTYGRNGMATQNHDLTLSMNLNQQA